MRGEGGVRVSRYKTIGRGRSIMCVLCSDFLHTFLVSISLLNLHGDSPFRSGEGRECKRLNNKNSHVNSALLFDK